MRLRTKGDGFLLAGILLTFLMATHGQAIAQRSATVSAQELSSQDRLEAEQRLWDLGYWAGPVDGKFDSDSRHE
jgi:hypothetical protein